jgi:hypothetical protein
MTAAQAIEYARFTTGGSGGEFPASVDELGLVNEAGEWLISAHDWAWTTSRIMQLSTKAGQDYLALPSDFAGDIATERTNALNSRFCMVSMHDLLNMRSRSVINSTLSFYGAVGYADEPGGGEPSLRILLWPTPQATEVNAFQVVYSSRWRPVGEASDLLTLPSYLITLYREVLVHITRGVLEEDQGTAAVRLQGLMSSDLFKAAVKADARVQTDYGQMTNTHTQMYGQSNYGWPYDWSYIQGPT